MFFQKWWELIIHIFVYMNNNTYHFYMEDQGKRSLDLKQIKKIKVNYYWISKQQAKNSKVRAGLTWTKYSLNPIDEILCDQISETPHSHDSSIFSASNGLEAFVLLRLVKHVTNPDGIHINGGVCAEVIEQFVVITGVVPAVCDHNHCHFSLRTTAIANQGVVGELQGRRRPRSSSDPLKLLHGVFEGGHWVDLGVVEANGLECSIVTVLDNADSSPWDI